MSPFAGAAEGCETVLLIHRFRSLRQLLQVMVDPIWGTYHPNDHPKPPGGCLEWVSECWANCYAETATHRKRCIIGLMRGVGTSHTDSLMPTHAASRPEGRYAPVFAAFTPKSALTARKKAVNDVTRTGYDPLCTGCDPPCRRLILAVT